MSPIHWSLPVSSLLRSAKSTIKYGAMVLPSLPGSVFLTAPESSEVDVEKLKKINGELLSFDLLHLVSRDSSSVEAVLERHQFLSDNHPKVLGCLTDVYDLYFKTVYYSCKWGGIPMDLLKRCLERFPNNELSEAIEKVGEAFRGYLISDEYLLFLTGWDTTEIDFDHGLHPQAVEFLRDDVMKAAVGKKTVLPPDLSR